MSVPDDVLAEAAAVDAADPLAHWRDRFVIPDPDLAYLDGNSLGMLPRDTVDRLHEVLTDEWADGLIRSWEHWLDLPRRVGDDLAPLLGATDGEVVVHDSTTINLHQLLHAAIALTPGCRDVVVDPGEFPTDRYVVAAVAEQHRLEVRTPPAGATLDDLDIDGPTVIVRSLVDYRSGRRADLSGFTARARAVGALVIWDLSHAVGAIEIDLPAADVDLAVGCTYKYLNGGPGAPGFAYVRTGLVERIEQPIRGWFGQADQFDMDAPWTPRPDIARLVVGTPGILGLVAARCGIELVAAAGMPAIAAKGASLTRFALDACDRLGLTSDTPREPGERGAHIAVRHPDAEGITRRLAAEHAVIADHRRPDIVRLGCSALTTRHSDVARAVTAIAALVD